MVHFGIDFFTDLNISDMMSQYDGIQQNGGRVPKFFLDNQRLEQYKQDMNIEYVKRKFSEEQLLKWNQWLSQLKWGEPLSQLKFSMIELRVLNSPLLEGLREMSFFNEKMDENAFRWVCEQGYRNTAQWLFENFREIERDLLFSILVNKISVKVWPMVDFTSPKRPRTN